MARQIRFCTSADGTRIAYTRDGEGAPLVRAAFYLNHLELDWECPVWRPYLEELSRAHALYRHDMRGFGLSDADGDRQSLESWVDDLHAVVSAAGLERFPLFGMCHGGAIAVEYAVRHPERVSHLVLFGAYARGSMKRATSPYQVEQRQLLIKLVELGWGQNNEAFQQVWATLLQPRSTLERLRALAELQRKSSSAANAVRLLEAINDLDITQSAPRVKCPTIVFHPREDRAAPFEEGRLLAGLIPGARLVPLDSPNHALMDDEPAWNEFVAELRAFLPAGRTGPRSPKIGLPRLTAREHDILERIAQGLDNAQIAAHLLLSEKTVRNNITRIFNKLGVENRPQAIVRAREAGLGRENAAA